MVILPAIDLRGGQCVRLTQGDYRQETVYDADPASVARGFAEVGAAWIHVVDLDGAREGRPVNTEAIRAIVAVGVPVQLGGGLRSAEAVRAVLGEGVRRVVMGSALAGRPDEAGQLFDEFGEALVAGIDARSGRVATEGWIEDSGQDAVALAQCLVAVGCRRFVFTEIARDGSLQGPDLRAVRAFVAAVEAPVIASGGVASLDDLTALQALGVEGAIVGKALYEGRFTLREAIRTCQISKS